MVDELRLDRHDKDVQRIMRGDRIVAMALRMADGRWGVFDPTEERRLLPGNFESPKHALQTLIAAET